MLNNPLNLTDPDGHSAEGDGLTATYTTSSTYDANGDLTSTYSSYSDSAGHFSARTDFYDVPSQDAGIDYYNIQDGSSHQITGPLFEYPPEPESTGPSQEAAGSSVLSNIGDYLTSAQGISTIANVASLVPGPIGVIGGLVSVGLDVYQGNYGSAALGIGGSALNFFGAGAITGLTKIGRELGAVKGALTTGEGLAREANVAGKALGRVVYRELSVADRAAFDAGESIVARGTGGTIAQHVGSQPTRYISASETIAGTERFSRGNGLVAINLEKAGAYIPHNNVLEAIRRGGTARDLANAKSAQEVLFKSSIPRSALTLIRD